jgi:erythromycin esterase
MGHSFGRELDERFLDELIVEIGRARVVMLGEASHGTHEYYTWRAQITKRLLEREGFSFVAVEGDWPDCYRVNRFVKGYEGSSRTSVDGQSSAFGVLHAFDRWPTWMWANWEMVAFVDWMDRFNRSREAAGQVGFYGLDVYSLWESLDAILHHLREFHPDLLEEGHRAFACFEPFQREGQAYGWYTHLAGHDCEEELVELLLRIRNAAALTYEDPESHFGAEQNTLAAIGAERYYRAMVRADDHSWNVRDHHMAHTLERLLVHHGPTSKGIVWAHNTHVGDARFTDMKDAGMTNLGQLARERYGGKDVFIVGFGGYQGSVIAGRRWGETMRRIEVPSAREDSWEDLVHREGPFDQWFSTGELRSYGDMKIPRGHRAIGVVYDPARESYGNYVPTDLANRYDAFVYFETTRALHPLHVTDHFNGDAPGTFPWGL